MKRSTSLFSLAVVAVLLCSPADAARILLHNYSAGRLTDEGSLGNVRPGTLGSAATLVQPNGTDHGYVNLPGGGTSSSVTFDTTGSDTTNLNSRIEPSASTTIAIWIDFDDSNTHNSGGGDSRFNLFVGASGPGSDFRLTMDHRFTNPGDDQRVGAQKDGDMVNGSHASSQEALASRTSVVGRHQWVYVFDGNGPSANGTFAIFRDGVRLNAAGFADTYVTGGGATLFGLAGSPNQFSVGGETSVIDTWGQGPIGKLYQLAIYDEALSDASVSNLFSAGLIIPEPSTLGLLGLGSLVLVTSRRRRR